MKLTVARAGFSTTVQDRGRFGSRQLGVSISGALDPHSLRVVNLLAGNDENAAGLEFTSGNVRLRFDDQRLIAWCGGEYEVVASGHAIPAGHVAVLWAGDELLIGGPRRGCRGWLAISGGIDVSPVLGSRATDLRAKFGGYDGRVLRDGDALPLGENSRRAEGWIRKLSGNRVAPWSAPYDWTNPARDEPVLRVVPGADWPGFEASAHRDLTNHEFTVLPASDRMGARLEGPQLKRTDNADLLSEAVAPGTIQVPPNGHPILLLGDCQTIGGYPKIAHVITVDLAAAAQLCAGGRLHFSPISLADAHRLLFERECEWELFRTGLMLHA
jgi:antagonist of KipI